MRGDPWGNSAHSALRWAYGLMARSESLPNIFGEMSGKTRVRTEMTMLDHRAQGAMIRSIVHRAMKLDPAPGQPDAYDIADDIIVTYYLPHPVKERQAGGGMMFIDRWGDERRRAIYAVAWWLLGQHGTGAHSIRAMMEIVAQHSLRRGGAQRLAKLMHKRKADALVAREAAFELLEQARTRALYRADEALLRAGLIESAAEMV